MENNKPVATRVLLPDVREFNQNKGGKELVDGWSILEWGSFGDYVREAFNEDTSVHPSFESLQDAADFIRGTGQYSERNGFLYDYQDFHEFQQEGYFQTVQCPECLEDLRDQLEADSIPEEDIVNPALSLNQVKHQANSFKPDEDKYVRKKWYRCTDHPEVYLMETESWYE